MVGNVCLAKNNQRLLITNYGSLGAASSFLLRSRNKPILHIRGTHLRSRSKSILREELINVQGASQFSARNSFTFKEQANSPYKRDSFMFKEQANSPYTRNSFTWGWGVLLTQKKRHNIWWGPKFVPCKTVHQRHSSSRFEMNLENSQKYWTNYFNFFFNSALI